ncbi:MAG: chromosome segregation protein SMC [archaeon]
MTIIKSVSARGFKSFAKKTELIFGNNFNLILGPNGSGKSTRWDTEILLSDGSLKYIGEIVDSALNNSNYHIKLDDGVFTSENKENIKTWGLEPKSMKVVEKDISAFIKRKGEPYLYEITTSTGKKVTTTGCHPVMIFKDNKIESELVRNLKKSDLIATPRILNFPEKDIKLPEITNKTNKSNKKYNIPKFLNKEIARFLGYVVGDGYIVRSTRIDFINQDKELINDFKKIAKSLRFNKITESNWNKSKAFNIYCYSKELSDYFIDLFKNKYTKEDKHIPSEILFAKQSVLANFLAGLFDCDAYVGKDSRGFEYCTQSKNLANQVQLSLLRFGIVSSIKEKLKYATNTEKKIKKKYYFLYVQNSQDLIKLYKNIPIRCKHKKERLSKFLNKKIIPNPNIDLLPLQVNFLIKECRNLLYIDYKPLRKEHPRFAAYNENRCNPTRLGVIDSLKIFENKVKIIKNLNDNIQLDQKYLTKFLKELNISNAYVAKNINVSRSTITDNWSKNLFNAKQNNLKNLYDFLKKESSERLEKALEIIQILKNISSSDIFWDKITSIEKVKGEDYVYDLTIPNCHNFIGNGIFVHNSNVIDMICFVLGESSAKSLRAEKSINLIYNGGKLGEPAKEAEVSIVFDNSSKDFAIDDKKVEITRILKRSGISVYKLNGTVMNKQEVTDMLASARIDVEGHNIILQGDIIRFMEMKPLERRQIIEEIAGISIYEEKKLKALNELDKVESKLGEAGIILNERKSRLKDLKKERDEALEYRNIEKNIKENKATYLSLQIKGKTDNREDIDSKINTNQKEIDEITKKIDEIKLKIKEYKDQISSINQEIEQKGEQEQVKLHKDTEDFKTDLLKKTTRQENCKLEVEKIQKRNIQIKLDDKDLNLKIQELKKSIQDLQKERTERSSSESKLLKELNTLREKYNVKGQENIETSIDNIQSAILKIQEEKQNLVREFDKLNYQLQDIDKKIESSSLVDIKDLKNKFKEKNQELNKALNEDSALSVKLSNLRQTLVDKNEDLAKLNIQSISSKQLTLDSLATSKILESGIKGIYNIVAELGEVEKKYSLALEVAAGPRLKSIVVEDDAIAAKCIKYLKDNKLGIATFLPLNKIKSSPSIKFDKKSDVFGSAIDLIKFDPKFKNIFSYVFGSTLVVDNLNTARNIGIGEIRMVTLDGDLTETSGAMIGGFRKSRGIAFKEIDFSDKIQKLETEVSSLKTLVSNTEQKRIDNENLIYKFKKEKADLEAEIIKIEKSSLPIGDLNKEKQELNKKIKELNSLVTDKEKEIASNNKSLESLKVKKQTVNIGSITEQEKQYQAIREKIFNLDSEIKNINTQLSFHQQETNKINQIMNNNEKEMESFKNEISKLNELIKEKNSVLKENEKKEKMFYTNFKSLFEKRNKINEFIQQKETSLVREEEKIKAVQLKINTVSFDKAKLLAELEALDKEFEPLKNEKIKKNINIDEIRFEIQRNEKTLQGIGNVNLRALEIYEELENDYDQLLEKAEKLKIEKEDVLIMMNEIEIKKTDLFIRTFDVIASNFKEIFVSLSTKGSAYFELEDPKNPLNAGIDVIVKISGNKYLDVRSLSGGEKTLTALAFIFAIQEYQPASFYLLDEVDAALDKTNSDKLSKLITQYSKDAQYIVVSHNDAVISEADQIYGVSMQQGISKVVSLKI